VLRTKYAIYLCRHNEVAFGQAIDLVGPQSDLGLTPGQEDVGMMTLILGQLPNPVHKGERLFEIGELELPYEVVLIGDLPFCHLFVESG